MTVKEIIEELKKLRPDDKVYVRGTNTLKIVTKVETATGQICFLVY